MISKIKQIFSILVVLYITFTIAQYTPYNIVNLRFQDDSAKLTELNKWISLNELEYQKIIEIKIEDKPQTFEDLSKDTTKKTIDNKFTYTEVKTLSSDIESFKEWNGWRMDFLIFNWTSLFLYFLYIKFLRRR